MAATFEPSSSSKSAAKFDPAELDLLNRQIVHGLPYEAAADRLADAGVDTSDTRAEAFWLAVRGNVEKVGGAASWWTIVTRGPADDVALEGEDLEYARMAFSLLPDGDVDASTWGAWTSAVKQATGRKGRALFMPLRIALTGKASGPEIADLLPLLGREGILARRP
jgi:glutamyl-tRNA synthetase